MQRRARPSSRTSSPRFFPSIAPSAGGTTAYGAPSTACSRARTSRCSSSRSSPGRCRGGCSVSDGRIGALAARGYLIVGSGGITHNVVELDPRRDAPPAPSARTFDAWVANLLADAENRRAARMAHEGSGAAPRAPDLGASQSALRGRRRGEPLRARGRLPDPRLRARHAQPALRAVRALGRVQVRTRHIRATRS